MKEETIAKENTILLVRVGSHMYGTHTPESDEDFMGVCIEPPEYVIGTKRFEQYQYNSNAPSSGKKNTVDDVDMTIYSLSKFIKLLTENNPNIVELPFAPENCIIELNDYGQKLIDNVGLFVSLKSYHTFKGYAYSQERRISHKLDQIASGELLLSDVVRGSRRELWDKHGIDTKLAYHLVRLYYEAIELLKTGRLTLPHIERKMLIDIKNGTFDWKEILALSNRLREKTEDAYLDSKLQYSANKEAINELQMELYLEYWREKGLL